jgi:5'-3' exonuclease
VAIAVAAARPTSSGVPLLVVDGQNLLYRAMLGFARAAEPERKPLVGAAGFLALLRSSLRDFHRQPEIMVCLDGAAGCSWRRQLWPAYKQQRPSVDGQILAGVAALRPLLDTFGVAWLELDDQEADDVIASLVALDPTRPTGILSSDRDLLQLVTDRVWVLDAARRPGQRYMSPTAVICRYGVTAGQWCDYRALVGDVSDNIPGVHGVGPARAVRLLAGGGRLEDLQELGRLTGAVGESIAGSWAALLTWRTLIRLRGDLQLPRRPNGAPTAVPAPTTVREHLGLQAQPAAGGAAP